MDEIARELELPREDVVLALDAIQDPVSLFEPVYNDDGDPIYVMDQIRDMKNTDGEMDRKSIPFGGDEKIISQGQHILTMRFFEGKTQMEVAGEIAISQAQVSRLEKNALKYMKKYIL